MKIAQFNTGTKSLLFVVIPKANRGYYDFTISEYGNLFGINPITKENQQCDLYLNLTNCTIISTLSNITEEQCKELGLSKTILEPHGAFVYWDYENKKWTLLLSKYSLLSAIKASKLEVGESEDILVMELKIEKS